ncbi:hypothetical protein [Saccharothrix texasensis]|uniref:Regulatory LuxR family protein n=1 Tax=Saccharothrix texasensis TaxID=103734 RepID=A0A3N1H1I3_9PSEU|nr:hypothetical protein [Saccharothrix texasensis]ROP36266.1 hypothetical protein EDD40_1531 [Saccharothrix texasensis]
MALRRLVALVLAGREPAEALPTDQRAQLVDGLVRGGLTDTEIAERLHMTTYTAARIRERLQLHPNATHDWRTAG